jgi:arginyl-tRNA synthetase
MITEKIEQAIVSSFIELYNFNVNKQEIKLQATNKEFEGDFTFVVFPFLRISKKSPDITAQEIGNFIKNNTEEIENFNVIKGFLNITVSQQYWINFLNSNYNNNDFFIKPKKKNQKPVLIEFSSPNTNKPLHLGHIRNNILGWSISEILKANGAEVIKLNLVNDRGIHICKSMLAWEKWGNNETPHSSGIKGDHLVGKYYVIFDKNYRKEVDFLISKGIPKNEAEKQSPLLIEAQEMLRKWENNDNETIELWKMMNGWVYEGFDATYKLLGIDFDKTYYESETYLLGKKIVEKGINENKLVIKEDGSVWADLKDDGLDEKLLLRNDGTSVYITQDLGTANLRYDEYQPEKMIYVVGNEQNYHFDVLKLILKKLGYNWADCIYHLSYGMVELPEGKMKSREGNVVDADDLIREMQQNAYEKTLELGKIDNFESEEAKQLFHKIALGALKYFILKVDPQKNMLFNPNESIDFNGNTGPFIQYTYARIKTMLSKTNADFDIDNTTLNLSFTNKKEKRIIRLIFDYPQIIENSANQLSPAIIANFLYELAKEYNGFYQEIPILKEKDEASRNLRLKISWFTANVLKSGMKLLGIEMPERM